MTYLLFGVIVLLVGVIVYLVYASGRERERLLDRIQAPEAAAVAAFAYPPVDRPEVPEFDFSPIAPDPDIEVLDYASQE